MVKDTKTGNLKEILAKGFQPSEKSKKFLDVLGPDNISSGLKNGLLRVVCNEDKTFDVAVTDMLLTDLESVLKGKLKERGYLLTVKGEKFVRDGYEQAKNWSGMEEVEN